MNAEQSPSQTDVDLWHRLKVDDSGLVPAIVQDHLTGEVRMLGYMNRQALAQTVETGRVTFYSRSRQKLWRKGETSGNFLEVRNITTDCDADALLVSVDPIGPTCHTGRPSCFFDEASDLPAQRRPFLVSLDATISARKQSSADKSYTRTLLDRGAAHIAEKIREEAEELSRALIEESDERVTAEAADLLFHALVGLQSRGLAVRDLIAVLSERAHISGIAEKANRTS